MGTQTSLVPALTVEQHASEIKNAMSRSIEGFIQVGHHVLNAKGQLEDSDFSSLFDSSSTNYVGMAERQGYRFLSIAKGEKKLLQFSDNLPSDVTQLDAISRMNVKDIKAAIKADVMSPSMNRGDITKWERSLQEPDPNQTTIELDYNNPDEVTDIESSPIVEKIPPIDLERAQFLAAVDVIIAYDANKEFRVKIINGLRKKWDINLTDLT